MESTSPYCYTDKSFLNLQKYIETQTGAKAQYMPLENGNTALPENPLTLNIYEKASKSGRLVIQQSGQGWAAGIPVHVQENLSGVWIIDGFFMDPAPAAKGKPIFSSHSWQILSTSIQFLTYEIITSLQEAKDLAFDNILGMPSHQVMERTLQHKKYGCLVVLDIGGLRKINEIFSRKYGDTLLRDVYQYIKTITAHDIPVYRLDAADFGILLENADEDEARLLARQLQKRCAQPWPVVVKGNTQNLHISMNICIIPLNRHFKDGYQHLSSAIEHTLAIARKSDGIAYFDDQENAAFQNLIRLETALRASVQKDMAGFYILYQPIADPGVALWSGLEALCRFESPDFGQVSPLEFIPIAETSGLIHAIGAWVLEESVQMAVANDLDQIENFLLSVNISPAQLTDPALDQRILCILNKFNYPAKKLCLEIGKIPGLDYTNQIIHAVKRLSALGILIALDDFTAGYASLSNLHRLPVNLIKTDLSFIANVESDTFLQQLFYVTAELAHASAIKIVAKGIENETQAQLLLKNGADFFQGFHFSKPLDAKEIGSFLGNFQNPVAHIISLGYNRLDLTRLSDAQGGYELPSPLYKLLSRCMQVLFSVEDGNKAIDTALAYIGDGLAVSRSYVFLKEADGTYTNTHEWCAKGIPPEKENLVRMDIAGVAPEWIGTLENDGLLVASNIDQLDPGSFEVLIQQGIKAVVEFPIMQDGELHGFVGFDDCEAFHFWTSEEIQMLHTLTNIIAVTLRKMQLQDSIATQSERMKTMLDNMDAFIYVSDLETNEILFANSDMQLYYENYPIVGRQCYEVLQGKTKRCDFCPIPHLLENPGESYQWEFYNKKANAHFKSSDSIIPWEDGKLAHFEYAVNITELKNYQLQLEEYATTDMLTHTLNRGHFIQQGEQALKAAFENNQEVTLAFIDIDGLKAENDQKGHIAGDRLIQAVVKSLFENIRRNDTIGRYGGDEFLILFFDCTPKDAKQRINMAQTLLRQHPGNENYSFSYGLASNHEADFLGLDQCLPELIHTADQRMILNKQSKKHQYPSRS